MRRWLSPLLCLLVSLVLWFIHNLSLTYSDIVSVRIQAESNIEGRARLASGEVTLIAKCKATGFRLLALNSSDKVTGVFFDPADLERVESDAYRLPAQAVYKYASEIFGDNVNLENVVSDNIQFRFNAEYFKKVPVRAVASVSFSPQHMAASDLSVSPDSILVYGSQARLNGISAISTQPIVLRGVDRNMHGLVGYDVPSGVRLSEQSASYTLEVSRFIEIRSKAAVRVRGVPDSVELSLNPAEVEVVYRCTFPVIVEPEGKVEFWVDYAEFENSISGECLIHASALPDGVIGYTLDSDVCECKIKL